MLSACGKRLPPRLASKVGERQAFQIEPDAAYARAVPCRYLFHVAQELVLRGLGEETAAGLVWALGVPWLRALLTAWLLAAWVCLFKRCETGEAERVQF